MGDICPYCREREIRFSSSDWRNTLRRLRGSRKRYCPSCGRKWLSRAAGDRFLSRALGIVAVVLLVALAAGLALRPRLDLARSANARNSRPVENARQGDIDANDLRASLDPGSQGDFEPRDPQADRAPGADPRQNRALADPEANHPLLAADPRGFSMGGFFNDIASLFKLLRGKGSSSLPAGAQYDLDHLDKRQLWEKYGKYFGSKEEAKGYYEDYKKRKASGEKLELNPRPD